MLLVHEKINKNIPPLEKQKPIKKAHEKEYEIKRNLQLENQSWNDWKFKIHLNKLEWDDLRSCTE